MDDLILFLEFPIDFKGQQRAHDFASLLLNIATVFSVLVGFFSLSIEYLVYTFGICLIGTYLITLPNWSFYTKDPVQWLQVNFFSPEQSEDEEVTPEVVN